MHMAPIQTQVCRLAENKLSQACVYHYVSCPHRAQPSWAVAQSCPLQLSGEHGIARRDCVAPSLTKTRWLRKARSGSWDNRFNWRTVAAAVVQQLLSQRARHCRTLIWGAASSLIATQALWPFSSLALPLLIGAP